MRKSALILTLSLLFFSCEKDYLIPKKDVPEWLRERIEQDEQKIKDSPHLSYSCGAWVRYEFQSEYYFEYYNPLSSAGTEIRDISGNLVMRFQEKYTDYTAEKCCKQFVWKAPDFTGMPGI